MNKNQHQQQEQEVNQNFRAFQKMLPKILQENPESRGRYALLKNRKLVTIMDTFQDAITLGRMLFHKIHKNKTEDQRFSVQEIRP